MISKITKSKKTSKRDNKREPALEQLIRIVQKKHPVLGDKSLDIIETCYSVLTKSSLVKKTTNNATENQNTHKENVGITTERSKNHGIDRIAREILRRKVRDYVDNIFCEDSIKRLFDNVQYYDITYYLDSADISRAKLVTKITITEDIAYLDIRKPLYVFLLENGYIHIATVDDTKKQLSASRITELEINKPIPDLILTCSGRSRIWIIGHTVQVVKNGLSCNSNNDRHSKGFSELSKGL